MEDVEKLDRLKEGKNNAVKNHSNSKSNPVFYLIDLNPDWEPKDKSRPPHRIKLGYTDRPIKERLSEFKTSSPTAKVIKIWPCLFEWEKAAITSITREGCIKISDKKSSEVFDCENLEKIRENADAFFSMMPNPKEI